LPNPDAPAGFWFVLFLLIAIAAENKQSGE
jgi:hypothetical protein